MKRQFERFARPESPEDRDRGRDAAAGRSPRSHRTDGRDTGRDNEGRDTDGREDPTAAARRPPPRDLGHDLRSPLGAMVNLLAILEEDHGSRLDAAGRDLLRRLAASAERARVILEASLDPSPGRSDGQRDVDQPTPADRGVRVQAPGSASDGSGRAPSPELSEILLVEDDPHEVSVALGAFRRHGLGDRVAVARDGQEALARLQRAAGRGPLPRVVFLDLSMPHLDGWGLLEALRSDPRTRHVPVVVVSSAHRAQDVREAYRRGANSFLRKGQEVERPEGSGAGRAAVGSERRRELPGDGLVEAARYWLERNEGCP